MHNELPTQQVLPVHACKTHHGQQLFLGCAIPLLLSGQAETSVGNRPFLAVLNLGKLSPYGLGRGVGVKYKLAIQCKEGQE